MPAAVAAILEGMPEPSDLRMHRAGGRCIITCGAVTLFDYAEADIGMRNLALVSLRSLGFRGQQGRGGAGAVGGVRGHAVEHGEA